MHYHFYTQVCHVILKDALERLNRLGYKSDNASLRAKHLFGLKIPNSTSLEELKQTLKRNNIIVSYRGEYMRLSCHVFNSKLHFDRLADILESIQ